MSAAAIELDTYVEDVTQLLIADLGNEQIEKFVKVDKEYVQGMIIPKAYHGVLDETYIEIIGCCVYTCYEMNLSTEEACFAMVSGCRKLLTGHLSAM